LIPPEIKDDAFYRTLTDIAARPDVATILEIGASSGDGSTEALVAGGLRNPRHPHLYCLELSRVRFDALQQRWAHLSWVHCYNLSSVPVQALPSRETVEMFYEGRDTRLRRFPLSQVLDWLEQDRSYMAARGGGDCGIDRAKLDAQVKDFDAVLIDGSEFTGEAELALVYGAAFVMLDDVMTYKNFANYERLSADQRYRLLTEDSRLRNGFAVFERRD
jgi:hypothetical protein